MKRFLERIGAKTRDPSAAPVIIVAIGDSVTQGCMEEARIDFDAVYHNQLKLLLERRYPGATFSIINAGCGGEAAPGGLARLERDVLRHKPDLVLIGYGLNDACSRGMDGLQEFAGTISTMVTRTREETNADVILLTPNMLVTHDNKAIADRWKQATDSFIKTQSDGILAAYARAIRQVAAENGVSVADVYQTWEQMAAAGVDTTARLCNGPNHPDRGMHRLTAELILRQIANVGTLP